MLSTGLAFLGPRIGRPCLQPLEPRPGRTAVFFGFQRSHVRAGHRLPTVRVRASGQPPEQAEKPYERELSTLLALLVRFPGLYGTAAVMLGYFLHMPATGNWHWDAGDALLGLKLAGPLAVLDTLLMLPNYAPGTTLKQVKIKVPRVVAERMAAKEQQVDATSTSNGATVDTDSSGTSRSSSSRSSSSSAFGRLPGMSRPESAASADGTSEADSSGGGSPAYPAGSVFGASVASAPEALGGAGGAGGDEGDLVEVEHQLPIAMEQPPLLAALYRLQMEKTATNAALGLSVPSELVVLLTHHLASEMLLRAVVLVWVLGWATGLLYAAGVDDWLYLQGGAWQEATPQVGAALAVVLCTATSVWIAVRREVYPIKLVEMLEKATSKMRRGAKGGQALPAAKPDGKSMENALRLSKLLAKMKARMSARQRWSLGVEAVRSSTETICYSAAFLLTGNLLAPYVAACANDMLFSAYQRLRQYEAEREQQATLDRLSKLSSTMAQLRGAKLARLQPHKPGYDGQQQRQQETPGAGPSSSGNGSGSTSDSEKH